MTISWDTTILPFHSVMFSRRNLSRSGGLTISGTEQVVQSSSDFWEAEATIKIRSREQRLAFRAYQAQNWGRTGQWLIPVCDPAYPVITIRGPDTFGSDFGADFGPDFSTARTPSVQIVVTVATVTNAAAKGDRNITFTMNSPPLPGMYFSLGSRLYLIGSVTPSSTTLRTYTANFAPKLRAATSIGATMEFANPRCLMRLAQDNIGQMNLDMLRFADVSLNFVEIPT
jgi:hypothetical protein